jgi:hypothetical protein
MLLQHFRIDKLHMVPCLQTISTFIWSHITAITWTSRHPETVISKKKRPAEIQWRILSFVSLSLTHLLCPFRTFISFRSGKQVHILLNYFLWHIGWFVIVINYSLNISWMLHRSYFFNMQVIQCYNNICMPHKPHQRGADCDALNWMILFCVAFILFRERGDDFLWDEM